MPEKIGVISPNYSPYATNRDSLSGALTLNKVKGKGLAKGLHP